MTMSLIDTLNPPQRQAVTTTAGPVLVLAGPGSGKTRVLTHRIAYLIDELGVEPWRIMAVTFTNKAADVMRERTEALLGHYDGLRGLTIGTFHRICARMLRVQAEHIGINPRYVIFDSDDQIQVIKQALRDLNIDEKRYRPRSVHSAISRAKNELILPADYPTSTYFDEIVQRLYRRYQELLTLSNGLDFDDLLMKTVFMLRDTPDIREQYQRRYEYILVDEFQDTNTAQYTLVQLLSGGYRNVFVVGDEDQSIYRFRGADYRNVDRFRKDFPGATIIMLEQNYRSTQTILDAANAVISRNRHRTPKKLFTDHGQGEAIMIHQAYDEHEEGDFILDEIARLQQQGVANPGDCAIMYRTNAQSRSIEEAFIHRGMPYRLVGATRFYHRREVKDILAYVRLVQNPDDDVSMGRIINVPPRRIGASTVNRLNRWAASQQISMYRALCILGGATTSSPGTHPFSKRALSALLHFYAKLQDWIEVRNSITPAQLLDRIFDESGYPGWLRDGSEENEDRWANVLELRTVSTGYDEMPTDTALDTFLEEVSLVSDVDNYEAGADAPTLLTLHAAKGLEFGAAFIVGCEDGLLPHANSFEDPESMEEERRLAYVGITRAKKRLYLLHTFRRSTWGRSDISIPSRFLRDIPKRLSLGSARTDSAAQRMSTWKSDSSPAPTPSPPSRTRSQPPSRPTPASGFGKTQQFTSGQRVRHAKFGEGTVISSRLTGDDEEVAVAFLGKGVKRLLASYARLETL
ncbi:MAG: UvrD-helicase domain-containing protein [Chloroflexi bacterium]|nr:UvrD-helicase domain-containing protein [Chloroflexota bacterium]